MKKPVIVRMNGKQTKTNKKNHADAGMSISKNVNREQAAAAEDNGDATIQAFVRNTEYSKPPAKRKRGAIKPAALAIAAAVAVGSILGLVMLYMFGGITDNGGAGGQPAAAGTDTLTETSTANDQPEMAAYVLQGGAFSEKENASAWADNFKQAGFPAVIWERDGQYYLFTGIADTKEAAAELIVEMDEHNLDVFVKEWETEELDQDIPEAEQNWINTFQKTWHTSLTAVSSQEEVTAAEWDHLLEDKPEKPQSVKTFAEGIEGIMKKIGAGDDTEAQQQLLKIWQLYEEEMIQN
jgi:stage II sporulation protein B